MKAINVEPNKSDQIIEIIKEYLDNIEKELDYRWDNWNINFEDIEVFEVVGSLLARQVSLATEFAQSISIWNEHIAPIILRTMVDTYITLAWILVNPKERAQKYILFGLGQLKLELEHRSTQLTKDGENPKEDLVIKQLGNWLNSQRYDFLTEVNIGSWSGLTTRKMAEEAGCIDFYNYAYTPFSAATHSMWQHVGRYNLRQCENPLHGLHKVPMDPALDISTNYLYLAGKYANKAFELFDNKYGEEINITNSFEVLVNSLNNLNDNSSKIE